MRESAHWDGDDLLYVGFPAGGTYNGQPASLLEIYIEKLGWVMATISNVGPIVQNGTTIYDRDQSGTAVNTHGGWSNYQYASFTQLTIDNVHAYGTAHSNCNGTISNRSCSGVTTTPIAAPAGGASCAVPPVTANSCSDAMGPPSAPILDAARSDGYYDGNIAIQGAGMAEAKLDAYIYGYLVKESVRDRRSYMGAAPDDVKWANAGYAWAQTHCHP